MLGRVRPHTHQKLICAITCHNQVAMMVGLFSDIIVLPSSFIYPAHHGPIMILRFKNLSKYLTSLITLLALISL